MGSLKIKHDLVNNHNKATKCMISFNALETKIISEIMKMSQNVN